MPALGGDPLDAIPAMRYLVLPPSLLQLFPVPLIFRINNERLTVQLQDHVGDERALRPKVRWVPG